MGVKEVGKELEGNMTAMGMITKSVVREGDLRRRETRRESLGIEVATGITIGTLEATTCHNN